VPGTPRRKLATFGILVGLFLSALDGTVVATALPRILDDLKGFQVYFLVTAVFMICQTVSMPIWGRLSDIYGRARFHLLAVCILVAGSMLCGLSSSMTSLLGYRALQGLGAGGLMSLSFTMIGDLFELEDRAKMQGAISSVWRIAALIGPVLGAWITNSTPWSWRGVFYLNLPVGVISAILVQIAWRERETRGQGRPDIAGAVLLALASAALMAAFGVAGREGWTSALALAAYAAAALFVVLLVRVERRTADPFIAYDLYRIRLFATGAATGVCAMICLLAAVIHVPLFVAGALGRDLQTGGLMLSCMMLPWMLCSAVTKPLLKRFSYRSLAAGGMVFSGAAYALLSTLDDRSSLGTVVGSMILLGSGLGLTVAPLLIAAQNAVPRERRGAATSLTQFTRAMGAAMGLAIMGSLFAAAFGGVEPEGIIKFRTEMNPQALKDLVEPLVRGLRWVFECGVGAAALGLVLALAIPRGKAQELQVRTS
jgi:EmrB/QacA subfamily drug resistance transporter